MHFVTKLMPVKMLYLLRLWHGNLLLALKMEKNKCQNQKYNNQAKLVKVMTIEVFYLEIHRNHDKRLDLNEINKFKFSQLLKNSQVSNK